MKISNMKKLSMGLAVCGALGLCSASALAAQFTELSNTDVAACKSALSGGRAVVVYGFQGCPIANSMRAEIAGTVDVYPADLDNVKLFYFVGGVESQAAKQGLGSSNCDATCVAQQCLGMSASQTQYSPISMIFRNGAVIKSSVLEGGMMTWVPVDFKNWILKGNPNRVIK